MLTVLGIDPGQNGGIAFCENGNTTGYKMPATERDIYDLIESACIDFAYIEAVHSMPKQGVKSSFSFGRGYGFLRGCLIASKIPFAEVRPQAWQKAMQCLTGGDKNKSKARAQQLFPNHKITHSVADAMLIARHGYDLQTKGGG